MSPSQPIRSLAAIVFTDIVGYSALVNRDDANAMRMVEEHFALVRKIATAFGGRVIKTIGDSVHLEFASAQAATAGSIAIQQAHQARNTRVGEAQRFDVRIGVHTGDVEHRGGDIYGDGVNISARLQPLAPVGGIAISDHVRNQLRLDLRNRFTSRGTPTLKNIDTPLELFVLEADALAGIDVETPLPGAAAPAPSRAPFGRPVVIVIAAILVVAALGLALALLPQLRSKGQADATDKSIAVLPFVDMSQTKDQEYFSDGIAEDLLNLLAKTESLQVAARTSSFSFKGQNLEIQEIARRLHVANVLEGSVRKAGNQVRVSARLVRAADGFEMWSQTWDRTLDDIFKVQDEIALAVVSELKIKLLGAELVARPIDPKVYPLILQAESQLNALSAPARANAIEILQQAAAIAPTEPRIFTDLARAHLYRALFDGANPAESARLLKEAANKALALDPGNVLALAWLGRATADFDLDLQAAADYYQRALEKEPTNLTVLNQAGALLTYIGRLDEGIAIFRYRVAHDPANPSAHGNLGSALGFAKQWDASIEEFRAALALNPEFAGARCSIGMGLLYGKRDAAGALKECEAETDELTRMSFMPGLLHLVGRKQESEAALQALIAKYGQDSPEAVASTASMIGHVDAAFEWLDKAATIRDPGNSAVLTDAAFESLHGDPRWIAFLRRIGFAPEQVAAIKLEVKLPQEPAVR